MTSITLTTIGVLLLCTYAYRVTRDAFTMLIPMIKNDEGEL